MPVYPRKDRRTGEIIPDVWDLVVSLPRLASDPAKRRRRSVTFRGTRARAERELHRLERDAERGQVAPGRLSVGHVFDRYLEEHVRTRLAPMTQTAYQIALTTHAQRLRAVPLAKLALHHLTAHEAYLAREAGGRRLSPVSVARYLNPVKSALEWAEAVDLLPRNPARHWKIPQGTPDERPAFTREEAARYLRAIADSPWRPHLLTLMVTGLRLSELRGLRWQDVDLETGAYQIHQQWQRVMRRVPQPDGSLKWQAVDVRKPVPKSRAGKRGGGLPLAVAAVLARWRTRQKEAKVAAGRTWKDPEGGALVFTGATGGPFDGDSLRHAHYRLLAAAKIARIHIHDLRHSWVTLQLEAGTDEHLVPKLAGHSPRVNEQIYRHATQRQGAAAAERLWAFLQDAEEDPEHGEVQGPKRGAADA